MNLLLALLLSREHTAHRQIVLPTLGYQLTIKRVVENFTVTVALWENQDGPPNAPHHERTFPSIDELLVYLDDWGVPTEEWYPLETLESEVSGETAE